MPFIHIYFRQMRTQYDRKGRPIRQYRDSSSFYDEYELKDEGDWLVIKSQGATHRFPKGDIAEIVEGEK